MGSGVTKEERLKELRRLEEEKRKMSEEIEEIRRQENKRLELEEVRRHVLDKMEKDKRLIEESKKMAKMEESRLQERLGCAVPKVNQDELFKNTQRPSHEFDFRTKDDDGFSEADPSTSNLGHMISEYAYKSELLDVSSGNAAIQKMPRSQYESKFSREFTVHKILGHGAFGYIFEAKSRLDLWNYTVQRVATDEGDTETNKPLRQVRTMAALDHPSIVRYHSTWIETPPPGWQHEADLEKLDGLTTRESIGRNSDYNSFLYIQMQLCKQSLTNWLDENDLSISRQFEMMKLWFKQIVHGVAYLHHKSLIHRDLKPSNILFSYNNSLKICDFGITIELCKKNEIETELIRDRIGTPLYMSPEQTPSLPRYSSKTDIFTLGLILTELCIVMTSTERAELFDNYRLGNGSNHIEDEEAAELVEWLTQVDPRKRPSCREILDHSFLASCTDSDLSDDY